MLISGSLSTFLEIPSCFRILSDTSRPLFQNISNRIYSILRPTTIENPECNRLGELINVKWFAVVWTHIPQLTSSNGQNVVDSRGAAE